MAINPDDLARLRTFADRLDAFVSDVQAIMPVLARACHDGGSSTAGYAHDCLLDGDLRLARKALRPVVRRRAGTRKAGVPA